MTGPEREVGAKWVRAPEFADDLEVSDLYEKLLADGEVTVTHEFRTLAPKPGEMWMPPTGAGFERYKQDLFTVRDRIAALARRAAEDGLKIKGEMETGGIYRRTRKYQYSRKSRRVLLDGPLPAEIADPTGYYHAMAERLFAEVLEKGETFISYDYSGHALLPVDSDTFLANEISWLAAEEGIELSWTRCDDIGEFVRVIERGNPPEAPGLEGQRE